MGCLSAPDRPHDFRIYCVQNLAESCEDLHSALTDTFGLYGKVIACSQIIVRIQIEADIPETIVEVVDQLQHLQFLVLRNSCYRTDPNGDIIIVICRQETHGCRDALLADQSGLEIG